MNLHRAGRWLGQPHQHAEQSRFADARRPDDRDEFAARDSEIEAMENLGDGAILLIGKAQAVDLNDRIHGAYTFHDRKRDCANKKPVSMSP